MLVRVAQYWEYTDQTLTKVCQCHCTLAPGHLSDLTPFPSLYPQPTYYAPPTPAWFSFLKRVALRAEASDLPGVLFLPLFKRRFLLTLQLASCQIPSLTILSKKATSPVTFYHITLLIPFEHFICKNLFVYYLSQPSTIQAHKGGNLICFVQCYTP